MSEVSNKPSPVYRSRIQCRHENVTKGFPLCLSDTDKATLINEMAATTFEFPQRQEALSESFHDTHGVVVFEKSKGFNRRVTGNIRLSQGGTMLSVYKPDGKYRNIPARYVVRIILLDYIPPN